MVASPLGGVRNLASREWGDLRHQSLDTKGTAEVLEPMVRPTVDKTFLPDEALPGSSQPRAKSRLESGTAGFQPLLVSERSPRAVVHGGLDSLTLSGMLTSHFGSSCWAPALSIQQNGQKFPFKETESLQWGDLVVSSYRAIGLVVVTSQRTSGQHQGAAADEYFPLMGEEVSNQATRPNF